MLSSTESFATGGICVASKMNSFLPIWSLIHNSDSSGVSAAPCVRCSIGASPAVTRWIGFPSARSTTSNPTCFPRQTKA